MGSTGSASKRKSSKKKSLKTSSQLSHKKKNRRKEPKKRRHDSVSDDDSLSSVPKSDYKRRTTKLKKPRCHRSVSSHSDDQSVSLDSDSLSNYDNSSKNKKSRRSQTSLKSTKKEARKEKKRKRSDKDRDVKPRKKYSKKKKSKKYSSSSSNSDSETSCRSVEDRKRKRSKIPLDNEIEKPRGRKLEKAHKKRKIRSPSCSSFDRVSDHSVSFDHSDGVLAPVVNNNPRRLKSVIIVVDKPDDEEENRWEKDPNKEEIVYDFDDYPSPKSTDSNEGVISKRDYSDDISLGVFDKESNAQDIAGEEVIDEGDQNDAGDNNVLVGAPLNNFEKEKENDDLELILRQKALENLRKFKGRTLTGRGSTPTANMKTNDEIVDVNKEIKKFPESGPTMGSDFSRVKEVKEFPESEDVEQERVMEKQSIAISPDEDKSNSSYGVLVKHVSGNDASPGPGPGPGDTKASSSSITGPISEEQSLEEEQNEAKDGDGSEFKQKTMSVMRGGEMVQVSYKVYIPKKVPALARRQLRR